MAKITSNINDNNLEQGSNNRYEKNKISTESVKPENTLITKNSVELNTEDNSTSHVKMNESQTIEWLIDFLGKNVFENIKANPNFRLPYSDENISLADWVLKALKTICYFDDIYEISNNIQTKHYSIIYSLKAAETELLKAKESISHFESELEINKQNLALTKKKIAELEIKSGRAVDIKTLNEIIYKGNQEIEIFYALLNESLGNEDIELNNFYAAFTKNIIRIDRRLKEQYADEEKKIEILSNDLRVLLADISGIQIPQRRPLLDTLARMLNKHVLEFIFVSPEESLQIDPEIHIPDRQGGSLVREGISYAVLRKQNRQTYIYADIKV